MPFTMEDFQRQYVKEHFQQLTPEKREEVLQTLPLEERLAGMPLEQRLADLSAEQLEAVREYLDRRPTAAQAASEEVMEGRWCQFVFNVR